MTTLCGYDALNPSLAATLAATLGSITGSAIVNYTDLTGFGETMVGPDATISLSSQGILVTLPERGVNVVARNIYVTLLGVVYLAAFRTTSLVNTISSLSTTSTLPAQNTASPRVVVKADLEMTKPYTSPVQNVVLTSTPKILNLTRFITLTGVGTVVMPSATSLQRGSQMTMCYLDTKMCIVTPNTGQTINGSSLPFVLNTTSMHTFVLNGSDWVLTGSTSQNENTWFTDIMIGANYVAFGHSYGTSVNSSHTLQTCFPARFANRLRTNISNQHIGGLTMQETAANAIRASSYPFTGVTSVMSMINDVRSATYRANSASIPTFRESLKAVCRLFSSISDVVSSSNTGTWTTYNTNPNYLRRGSAQASTVDGSTLTFLTVDSTGYLAPGDRLWLLLYGTAGNGSTYSVTLDGVQVATGTTVGLGMTTPNTLLCPIVVDLGTASPDVHTVVVTKTGSGTLYVGTVHATSQLWTPEVLVIKDGYAPDFYNASVGMTLSNFDAYYAAMDVACAGIPYVRMVDLNAMGWNRNTMMAPDGLHPNDMGCSFIANSMITSLRGVTRHRGFTFV